MDHHLVEAMRDQSQYHSWVGRLVAAVVLGILAGVLAYTVIR